MFCFRIDIDSRYGLVHGVPNILDSLRTHGVKASFFIPMGGESTLGELIAYRGGPRGTMSGVKLPKLEVARMAFFPKNFAAENVGLLERIVSEGHSLGVHGFKHRAWTRALDKIDAHAHVAMATARYRELFGVAPTTFAAPAFRTNAAVLDALDSFGYVAAGDLPGDRPFHPVVAGRPHACVQVPVNLKMPSTDPLVEALCLQGLSDSDVISSICTKIDESEASHGFSGFYCHDFFEGVHKPHVIDAILSHVKQQGFDCRTMEQAALAVMERREVSF